MLCSCLRLFGELEVASLSHGLSSFTSGPGTDRRKEPKLSAFHLMPDPTDSRVACLRSSACFPEGALPRRGRKAFLWSGRRPAEVWSPKANSPLAPSLPLSPVSSSAGGT